MTTVTRMETLRHQKRRQLRAWRPRGAHHCDCWHFEAYHRGVGGNSIPFGRAGNAERRTICMVEGWGLRCRVEVLNERSIQHQVDSGLDTVFGEPHGNQFEDE